MIKEYGLVVSEVFLIISVLASLISPFFFRSRGLITGKTIILMSVCFGILIIAFWVAISINNPAQSTIALICLSGIGFSMAVYFGVLYFRLPSIRKKKLEIEDYKRKHSHRDKGSSN